MSEIRSVACRYMAVAFFGLIIYSCKKNEMTGTCSAKYGSDIQPIVSAKCALASCHAAGSSLPDLTNFSVLKTYADNGRIETNIFDLKIMPPASAAPLSEDEKNKFKCWLDNGAQQN